MEYFYKLEDKRYARHTVNNTRETCGSCYGIIRDTITGKERRVAGSEVFGLYPVNAIINENKTAITVTTKGSTREFKLGIDTIEAGVFKMTISVASFTKGALVKTEASLGNLHYPRNTEVLNILRLTGHTRLLEIKRLNVDMSGWVIMYVSVAGRLSRVTFVPGESMPMAECVGSLDIRVFGAL